MSHQERQTHSSKTVVARPPDPVTNQPSNYPTNQLSDLAWSQHVTSGTLGEQPTVSFIFNPLHLRRLFAVPAAAVRGQVLPVESLLLDDQMIIHNQPVAVQAWIVPSPHQRLRYHIRLCVTAPQPLATPLRATLRWGGDEYTTCLAAGQATFEDISPPDFSRARTDEPSSPFRLILEPITNARA